MKLRFTRRLDTPKYIKFTVSALSLGFSLLIGFFLFLSNKVNPFLAYGNFFAATFGSFKRFSVTLMYMIPISLCALSVSFASEMKLWNIGGEGQMVMGAIGACFIPFTFPGTHPLLMIPLMILSGIIFAVLIALVPGVLKATLGVNEILVTLMFNYIAIALLKYFIFGPWNGPGNQGFTEEIPSFTFIPKMFSTRLHIGFFAVFLVAAILFLILKKTVWGYQIKVQGESLKAAKYSGMKTNLNIVLVLIISGAVAGLAGVFEVMGNQHELNSSIARGYGFTGIIASWLSKKNYIALFLISFGLAMLNKGGEELEIMGISKSIVTVFYGILLLFVLSGDIFSNYKLIREKV